MSDCHSSHACGTSSSHACGSGSCGTTSHSHSSPHGTLDDEFLSSAVHTSKQKRDVRDIDLRKHDVVPPRLLLSVPLLWEAIAELIGTFFMVFIGTGVVATAITTDAQAGIWQVAVVWGFAVTLAIFLVGPISGAHLNPAVTLTLVVFRRKDFEARILLAYVPAQLLGAFLAGLIVYGVWEAPIAALELRRNITRGQPGSALSAMMFGEYFPNPAAALMTPVSVGLAFGVEVLGTFLLMLVILAFTDFRNVPYRSAIVQHLTPYFIGSCVACVISIFGPFTQAGLNPARDFGPRLVALAFGWGAVAIPGPQNGFWVYLVAPCVGALTAGLFYKVTIGRHFKEKCLTGECKCD